MIKYTIQKEDIGKRHKYITACACCDKKIYFNFGETLGKILPCDVGKIAIYNEEFMHWSIENEEQFLKRIN